MAGVDPIRTEGDYEAALVRINELMDALSGSEGQVENTDDPDRVELDILTDLVESYEERHHSISCTRCTGGTMRYRSP